MRERPAQRRVARFRLIPIGCGRLVRRLLASLEPSEEFPALASSGLDPVTGAQTLVLDAPANPPHEASLKVATVIVALDKSATGRNTTMNLTEVTSQYLALMAAGSDLREPTGIRLLVQELILTLTRMTTTTSRSGSTARLSATSQTGHSVGDRVDLRADAGDRFGAATGGTPARLSKRAAHAQRCGGATNRFRLGVASHEMGHVFGWPTRWAAMNARTTTRTARFSAISRGSKSPRPSRYTGCCRSVGRPGKHA